jgi:hypothetical protein
MIWIKFTQKNDYHTLLQYIVNLFNISINHRIKCDNTEDENKIFLNQNQITCVKKILKYSYKIVSILFLKNVLLIYSGKISKFLRTNII